MASRDRLQSPTSDMRSIPEETVGNEKHSALTNSHSALFYRIKRKKQNAHTVIKHSRKRHLRERKEASSARVDTRKSEEK